MFKHKIRLLPGNKTSHVSNKIKEWGYHYPLEAYRWDALIFEIGDQVSYTWFEKLTPKSYAIHMCSAPQWRGKVLNRDLISKLKIAAEIFGADYIYIITQNKKVNSVAKRLGFEKVKFGIRLKLSRY